MKILPVMMLSIVCLISFNGCAKVIKEPYPVIQYCKEKAPERLYTQSMCDKNTFKTDTNTYWDSMEKCIALKIDALLIDIEEREKTIDRCGGL